MSLVRDFNPLNQPENTLPFVLNGIKATSDNMVSAISSEPGNELFHTLDEDYDTIGKIYFTNKILIFSTDNTTSRIGILSEQGYEEVIDDSNSIYKLNFNTQHKILGEHRISQGCEDTFYFCDGINPDRYLNLTEVPEDLSLLNLKQNVKIPTIHISSISNSGGRIPSGSLSFALKYVDVNSNTFYTSDPTHAIPIYIDPINQFANGSEEVTNKSVSLTVSNTDDRFPYVKLIAIHNNQEVYEVDQLYQISDDLNIVYTGPSENDIRLDSRELLVGTSNYNNSLVIEQVQNRLLRANVQELTEDYSGIQRMVNDIVTKVHVVPLSKSVYAQNPNYYSQGLTFQSEEVYALGIRFKDTKTSKTSPVFHVPGPEATTEELELTTFKDEQFPRYQLEDFSVVDWYKELDENNRFIDRYDVERYTAFYSNSLYPDTKDCNGEYIYGDLASTPIRHHKMPSRSNVPLDQEGYINQLTLKFDNIQLPQGYDDYEILYVQRNERNSTVLDSGRLEYYYHDKTSDNYQASLGMASNINLASFISPKTKVKQSLLGDYFRLVTQEQLFIEDSYDKDGEAGFKRVGYDTFNKQLYKEINENVAYTKAVDMSRGQVDNINFDKPTIGTHQIDYIYDVETPTETLNPAVDQGFDFDRRGYYAINKRLVKPYNDLQNLRYSKLTKYEDHYIGDTFIINMKLLSEPSTTADTENTTDKGNIALLGSYVNENYVETSINYNLKFGDNIWDGDENSFKTYLMNQPLQSSPDAVYENRPIDYNINNNYNIVSFKSYFPLPQSYDYCDKCRSRKPTRIIFSPQAFEEELNDTYLIAKVNDYIDLPSNTGPITGIKYKNNRLYVHTTQTTYILSPSPQHISTSTEVAQLVSGDFLSTPPQQIIQTDFGYGGLQSKTATIDTEHNYMWIDGLRGSIMRLTSTLEDSTIGRIKSWLRNTINESTEFDLGYDPFYQRILITIKTNDTCQPNHTISFSPYENAFTSYHSYFPNIYLNDSNYYYTCSGNQIYRHLHKNNYCTFNGQKHPFIVEQVDTKFNTSNLYSITHYSEFFEDDQEVEDSFTALTVYNSNQSTGRLDLTIPGAYGNLLVPPTRKTVRIVDKNHHISNIWDNSTSQIVYTDPCNETVYTNRSFVNTNQNGTHYNKPMFREKYTIVRLEYLPTQDRRVTHYFLQHNKRNSVR